MAILRILASSTLTLVFFLAAGTASAAQTGDFPLGTYECGPFTITFEQAGTFRVVHSSGAGVTGVYRVTGNQIEISDRDGELACQDSDGKYTWKLDQGSLILSVVDDACDARAEALTSKPMVKKDK